MNTGLTTGLMREKKSKHETYPGVQFGKLFKHLGVITEINLQRV